MRSECRKKAEVLNVVGFPDDDRTYEEMQIYAFAAAQTCLTRSISVNTMAEISNISTTIIYTYIEKLAKLKSGQSMLSIMPRNERPPIYEVDVDAAFIIWLEDPQRVYSEKMIGSMVNAYNKSVHPWVKQFHLQMNKR